MTSFPSFFSSSLLLIFSLPLLFLPSLPIRFPSLLGHILVFCSPLTSSYLSLLPSFPSFFAYSLPSSFYHILATCFHFTSSYLKGQLPRQPESKHDHPCHPEEQNVMARLKQRGGVVFCQVRRFPSPLRARPPQRCEGEQRRGKPGVQDVLILLDGHDGGFWDACFGREDNGLPWRWCYMKN